jgi:hypothetical protein
VADSVLADVLAQLKALKAHVVTLAPSGGGVQDPGALPDICIEDVPGVRGERKPRMRVDGPYPHGKRWRVRIRRDGGQTVRSYETREAAEAGLRQLRREAARLSGLLAKEAIERYRDHLTAKGNRPRSIETTIYRLTAFFRPVLEEPITALTSADGVRLYDRLLEEKTRFRRAAATDTRLNITAEARTFGRWCRGPASSGKGAADRK